MAGIKLPQFLRRYNLTMLAVATDDIVPGAVLSKKRGHTDQGRLSEIITSKPAKFWKTELNAANIVYGTVERSLSLKGKTSLNQMGAKIEGGLSRARSVEFSISEVKARTFRNGPGHASMLSLVPLVNNLRRTNRAAWKQINGSLIVLEVYYASEVTLTFTTNGNVDLKADIAKAGGVEAGGDAGITWKGKRSFKIAGNTTVPFAFRGWKV